MHASLVTTTPLLALAHTPEAQPPSSFDSVGHGGAAMPWRERDTILGAGASEPGTSLEPHCVPPHSRVVALDHTLPAQTPHQQNRVVTIR